MNPHRRPRVAKAVLWSALLPALSMSMQPPAADEPAPDHVVVFLADDLGWGDVGYHGSRIRTPHLDRLREAGLELDAHYVLEMCSPTRAALLTGRHPMRYGMATGVIRPWSGVGLDRGERLLPERLKEAGYATHLVGKWHLGCNAAEELPTRRGFDHFYGQYTGLADHFERTREGGLDWRRDEEPLRESGYTTHLLREEALRVVRAHDAERPLFLLLAFTAPHHPLQAPAEEVEAYADVFEDPDRRTYAAMVTCLDEAVGAVLAALEERGMRERTLVLFLSDNGATGATGPTGGEEGRGGSNGPLRGGKRDLHEGGVRVPALVHRPGVLEGGGRVSTVLHVTDWFPTILARAGLAPEPASALDGLDLGPHLALGEPLARDAVLINVSANKGALRAGDTKLICDYRAREGVGAERVPWAGVELYDLARDPGETRDLAPTSFAEHRALLRRLNDWRAALVLQPGTRHHERPAGFEVPAVWGPR